MYGRVPFSKGEHPLPIKDSAVTTTQTPQITSIASTIIASTTSTILTTPSTTPSTVTTTMLMLEPVVAETIDENSVHKQGYNINEDEIVKESSESNCEMENCDPSLEDGTIRLSGGRDGSEVCHHGSTTIRQNIPKLCRVMLKYTTKVSGVEYAMMNGTL